MGATLHLEQCNMLCSVTMNYQNNVQKLPYMEVFKLAILISNGIMFRVWNFSQCTCTYYKLTESANSTLFFDSTTAFYVSCMLFSLHVLYIVMHAGKSVEGRSTALKIPFYI